jgi:hypothetical protein
VQREQVAQLQQDEALGGEQDEQHHSGHRGQALVARRVGGASRPLTDFPFSRRHGHMLGLARPAPG